MWCEAFSDSEEYVNHFFDSNCAKTYVYTEDDTPVGMVSVFDISLNEKKGGYIYALVVDKQHRGKGVACRLLQFVDKTLKTSGYDFSLAVPSPYESLEPFYKRFGFDREVKLGVAEFDRTENCFEFDFEKATAQEYQVARQNKDGIVLHTDEFYNYIYEDLVSEGVEILKIRTESKNIFCVCYNNGEYVIMKELLGETNPEKIAQIVMKIFDVPKAFVVSSKGENYYPYALFRSLRPNFDFDEIYANLLLDDFENRF